MIGLAYLGIAMTSISPQSSHLYWLAILPVYAAVGLYAQWARHRHEGIGWATLLRTQIFHWGGVLVSIQLVYLLLDAGRLNYESTGFIIHLFLAFAIFLVGVYVDWRFYLVSFFLALSLVLVIYVAAYIWIILLLAIATVVAVVWLNRKT
jgi:hypothetical protein